MNIKILLSLVILLSGCKCRKADSGNGWEISISCPDSNSRLPDNKNSCTPTIPSPENGNGTGVPFYLFKVK